MRRLLATAAALLILLGTVPVAFADNPKVKIQTNKGDVVVELFSDKAPLSVDNFLTYVDEGFYNGTIFHRVIEGFMIQGGGFGRDMKKKSTHAPVKNEADNGLKNERGTLAMARTRIPDSATAQFFINHKDNDSLNHRSKNQSGWGYAVFGKVTEGMDVVDAIATTPTGPGGPFPTDVPETTIEIEKITRIGG
jgi:peptidyl-prolyl cis-trans isomerase B (cyclophilin B)